MPLFRQRLFLPFVFVAWQLVAIPAAAERPTDPPSGTTAAPVRAEAEAARARRQERRAHELSRARHRLAAYERRKRARGASQCHASFKVLTLEYCRLSLVPLNITAGVGSVFDSAAGRGAFFVGVEVAHFSWRSLAWTPAEAQLALYETCPRGDDSCSGQGSFFVGTRPGYAMNLSGDGRHQVVFGAGMGWGQIGKGFRGRDPDAHGFVLSPSVRYDYRSAYGLQLQAFLPVYSGLGEHYPMAVTLNVMGVPTLILAGVLRIAGRTRTPRLRL